MDGLEIAHRRLWGQHLSGAPLPDPVAVVRHLGAVQAQEFALAKWSLGQRTGGFDDDVQRVVDAGGIVRTHALRPTWHFLAAADVGWVQALTAPRVHTLNGPYYRLHGLDEHTTARHNAVIGDALRGGNHLTRPELAQALAAAGLPATGNRLAYIVMRAELAGLIGNGAMRGRQHTYALLSERVQQPVTLAGDAALAELTRRYFTSHGPATVKDFGWWSSLTAAQIRRGLDLLGPALAHESVDGIDYWFDPASSGPRERAPSAHVLQGYDEFVVAYTQSRPVINVAGRPLHTPGGNTLINPVILDGQLAGWWRRTTGRGSITAELTLALHLGTTRRRAVEAAFERYAEFAGLPVTVVWPL